MSSNNHGSPRGTFDFKIASMTAKLATTS